MLNRKRTQRLSSLFFFILLFRTAPTWSTTVLELDLRDMANQADLIIVGHCEAIESVWVGRMLFTRYTMAVDETVNGEDLDTVKVMVPGGIDLNRPVPIGMSVPDAPVFFPDERDVLLLTRTPHPGLTNTYSIVGFNQGRFKIREGSVLAQGLPHQKLATDTSLVTLVETLRSLKGQDGPPTSPKRGIFRGLIEEVTP